MMAPPDVATFLGTTPERLARWRHEGSGPPWTKVTDGRNGLVRYPREDLRRYLAARTQGPVNA
jgi:predicted site-specific integrase-resolvase